MFHKPRVVIAALRGGAGKTLISLGLAAAWRIHRGLRVVPFKKGPDYIDAGWLSVAAGSACYNLDPFLMSSDEMLASFVGRSGKGDISLVEGNRGLYDGVDVRGSFSTAELAKLLRAPVVLVLDATKVTRTAAALVLGCRMMDPEVRIAGVILNQVAGKRHEQVLRGSIEETCQVPVLGVIPKETRNFFPERHLGLVPPQEANDIPSAMEFAAGRIRDCVDLDGLFAIAGSAGALGLPATFGREPESTHPGHKVTIGVIRDAAFQFYYPENLEALAARGATVLELSSFENRPLPDVDALYIGGGFPETHLDLLAANTVFRESLKAAIEAGLPVYAECGGLMYLCRSIAHQESRYPMTGVFPFEVVLERKPQGHGYTRMECVAPNPYFQVGETLRGHEFHYSRLIGPTPDHPFIFRLQKGHGIVAGWDGICYKNVLAGYSHIHAVGNGGWADALVRAASSNRSAETGSELKDRSADFDRSTSSNRETLTAS